MAATYPSISYEISIHAPLAGRDAEAAASGATARVFQSTRPLRGATIHRTVCPRYFLRFQSTRPLRGATIGKMLDNYVTVISIHAPLAGRDRAITGTGTKLDYFNPRAPCGARRTGTPFLTTSTVFQSTRPLRGATPPPPPPPVDPTISIHAPLAGRDKATVRETRSNFDFNPRAPCGARRLLLRPRCRARQISIHAPLAGRDSSSSSASPPCSPFQSTRPLRGATKPSATVSTSLYFNPRAPCGARPSGPLPCPQSEAISIHAPLAGRDSKLDEFLSANLRKSNKRDLLSEEKMRHGLPRTTCMSHFRSFFGCEAEAVFCPLALRT